MTFDYFSKNGKILPIQEATVSLFSIEYAYGFGVYETIRVSNRTIHFLDEHISRFIESAKIIDLEHNFSEGLIKKSVIELAEKNGMETCNIKMLLIGSGNKENAQLFITCLNPLFPDKKIYREGVSVITYNYERAFPHAKTLNMFQSYYAYKKAKEQGAYDALFINHDGYLIEGTRTNFFCIKNKTIYTPPEDDILLGVTRAKLLMVALDNGYEVEQKYIKKDDVSLYEGAFLSSTSTKIVPINKIDELVLPLFPESLKTLMRLFNEFLKNK